MGFIMEVFGAPLGLVMWLMYQLVSNYAIALILFTIIIKLCLVPLAIKQQRGSIQMQLMQPKIREIQNRYKDGKNQMEMQQELQELYKKENYSMTAGCMPLLIQMPILFGLIDVVYKPLKHILRIDSATIDSMKGIMEQAGISLGNYAPEITILKTVQTDPSLFLDVIGSEIVTKIQSMDMMFLGLDMTQQPSLGFNLLMLVPIISCATAYMMTMISMRNNPQAGEGANASTMKTMMYVSPLMSLWFTFMVPVGVGMYWIISNIFGCLQALVLNKFFNPKEIAEKMKAEAELKESLERKEKIEAKKLAKEKGEKVSEKGMSQKEINRQKLAAARKRNAEKYGDYENFDDEENK